MIKGVLTIPVAPCPLDPCYWLRWRNNLIVDLIYKSTSDFVINNLISYNDIMV